ncbi:hypothetical protein RB195_011020 [Necator americanus]|uniref:Uncharacterized protein n=1 Tax=Necator americanus TaxID=51031 RepID=A0ABR1D0N1_NECAM
MVFALLSFTDQWKLIVVAFSAKLVNNQRTASATHRLLPHRRESDTTIPFPIPLFSRQVKEIEHSISSHNNLKEHCHTTRENWWIHP